MSLHLNGTPAERGKSFPVYYFAETITVLWSYSSIWFNLDNPGLGSKIQGEISFISLSPDESNQWLVEETEKNWIHYLDCFTFFEWITK